MPSLSSRQQAARYLAETVGAGNVCTFRDVRDAVPHVAQLDRRVRELREFGWRIDTYKTDPALSVDELRVTAIGERIWIPGARRRRPKPVTATARRAVLDRDGRRCTVCGVGAGEPFPDPPHTVAHLTVTADPARHAAMPADDLTGLHTECQRCRRTPADRPRDVDVDLLEARIGDLTRAERSTLARWMLAGRRDWTPLDIAWAAVVRLDTVERARIGQLVANDL